MADPGVEPEWWYNERTGEAEHGRQAHGVDRIGPFRTREDAQRAPEIVAERARRWREESD
ncbi:MAG: methionine aminopeptidase [Microbacteriaceae bacterium]|nr:methionine aminopeptidase [Microbacteriaceae bacterium]